VIAIQVCYLGRVEGDEENIEQAKLENQCKMIFLKEFPNAKELTLGTLNY